jgi:hypothetical protein
MRCCKVFTFALALLARPVLAITIPTVSVGDLGNPSDPATGYGGVSNAYNIAKYEVTVDQYTAFLNAVASTDTYHLYNPSMASDANSAGISRIGASGSYTYSVIGSPDHPVTYVGWGDAARLPTGCTMASRPVRKTRALPKTERIHSTARKAIY